MEIDSHNVLLIAESTFTIKVWAIASCTFKVFEH